LRGKLGAIGGLGDSESVEVDSSASARRRRAFGRNDRLWRGLRWFVALRKLGLFCTIDSWPQSQEGTKGPSNRGNLKNLPGCVGLSFDFSVCHILFSLMVRI